MSARGPYGSVKINLPSLDSLFSTEEERQEAKLEKVREIPISELYPFTDHPFQVRDDEEMQKMVESVKTYGVLTPLIVRPRDEGGFEMIAGHRRKHACELAGIEKMPVIIREMDDDTAVILMVDSNCQRENISAIEKAKAYKMKLEAIKRQAGRPSKENSRQVVGNLESAEIVGRDAGESGRQVQRYIRLNELIPKLQDMVEEKKLKFNPAVELSYLTPEEQEQFLDYIDSEGCTPSLSQAQQLKAASKEKILQEDKLKSIMAPRPPAPVPSMKSKETPGENLMIPVLQVQRFFPQDATREQMLAHIIRALEAFHRSRQQRGQER